MEAICVVLTTWAASIRSVASTIAFGTMSHYNGNVSTNPLMVGDLPEPYYWWEAGAMWGAMLDYYHYTGDYSYNEQILQALLAPVNTGPAMNYMAPDHAFEEGNDDLGFWSFAVMSAAERNFPQPKAEIPPWLKIGENIFNELASRWNTTHCGGGLLWQIFDSNPNGKNYKNSVSNGGLFQLAARLARATGNPTYLDWATKVWDWSAAVGFIDEGYNVYDGADSRDNCTNTNHLSFTYSTGIYLYGAAVLANHTGQQVWLDRANGLLTAAHGFFSPFENATNIMYEPACETVGTCNVDMKSFKGYLSRFMWQSAKMVPSMLPTVKALLEPSALAAAKTCTGGEKGATCGQLWYVGGFDGSIGLGQQMCALETVQGLLVAEAPAPFREEEIQVVRELTWLKESSARRVKRESATGVLSVD
jgi:mannan endo-1,6-alpha-mannosidase